MKRHINLKTYSYTLSLKWALLPLLYFSFIQNNLFAQSRSAKLNVGDVIHEVVFAKGADNLTYELPLKSETPSKSLILLYRFNENENVTDNADSLKYVESITSYLGKTLKNDYVYLRPYVISSTKERLSKLGFKYHYEHSVTAKISGANNITSNSLFSIYDTIKNPNSFVKADKLIIMNHKGKVLATSASIAGFSYNGKKMSEILDYMSKVKNPEPVNTLDSVKNDITLIPPVTVPITIKGKVLGQSNNDSKPLRSAYVSVIEEVNSKRFDTISKTKTDINGNFSLILPKKEGNYKLRVVSPDKKLGAVVLTNKSGFEIATMEKIIDAFEYKLIPGDIIRMSIIEDKDDIASSFKSFNVSKNKEVKIEENVIYGSGKFELDKESMALLDKVVDILKTNPQIKLEVISHTDSQGDDAENMALSLKRSTWVLEYLIANGIDKNRLVPIGKGESEIRNRCKNGVDCTDEEHAYNRRTEFHFLK